MSGYTFAVVRMERQKREFGVASVARDQARAAVRGARDTLDGVMRFA
ncbi:hypothetical protein [Sulfitobacter sp. TBRI5]